MENIKTIAFFPNGNVLVLDDNGVQISELQGSWFRLWMEQTEKLGYNIYDIPEIRMPSGKICSLIKLEDGFNWEIKN